MTIDERLDRLTERHEALTQTVELIAAAQIKNDERFGQVARNFEIVLDSIKRLERIAAAHEQRIENLEEGQQ
jgi:archaellum component FlaC